jgi:hypothetical protein
VARRPEAHGARQRADAVCHDSLVRRLARRAGDRVSRRPRSLGPNLDYLLKAIRPSVAATRTRPEAERLRAAILENVEETLNDMVVESTSLRDAARAGHVGFVGAYYEMSTGKVHFSELVHLMGTEARR